MEFFLNEMEHNNISQNPQIMSHDDLVICRNEIKHIIIHKNGSDTLYFLLF